MSLKFVGTYLEKHISPVAVPLRVKKLTSTSRLRVPDMTTTVSVASPSSSLTATESGSKPITTPVNKRKKGKIE